MDGTCYWGEVWFLLSLSHELLFILGNFVVIAQQKQSHIKSRGIGPQELS